MIDNSWMNWQLDYLLLLQNFRDLTNHVFDSFFLTVTMFGEVLIPTMVMSAIYWCINKKAGTFIIWTYMLGFLTNLFLKTTACIYRPWILDGRIHPLEAAIPAATGYSFPSGHTAGAISTWGGIAIAFWKNKFIRYACFLIVFLVMLSRNYVGVHTPQDVIVSFCVGVCLLFFVYKILDFVNQRKKSNIDLLIITAITLLSVAALIYINIKNYPISCFGITGGYNPEPYKIESFGRIGMIIGVFWGWFLENRYVKFDPSKGSLLRKVVRFVIGFGVLYWLFYYGKSYFTFPNIPCGLFLGNLFTGMFITFIYPYLISKKIV